MRVLIVDDEALARQQLVRLLGEIGGEFDIVAEASSGDEALSIFDQKGADLVLLDIRMPGIDGLEVGQLLANKPLPPAIIFVTAYDEHAIAAFQAQAAAYLLKPVRKEHLQKALLAATQVNAAQLLSLSDNDNDSCVSASFRGGIKRVPLSDIYYFRAENKYVVAYHQNGQLVLEDTLKDLETRYADRLVRIHRNALISVSRLQAIEKASDGSNMVRLEGCDELLEVSRRHAPDIRKLLKG